MKKQFVTLFLVSLFVTACKKEAQPATDEAVIGQWRWISQSIGAPSNTATPQNTGIEETLIFKNDNSWLRIQNSDTVSAGTFTTAIVTSNRSEQIKSLTYRSQSKDSVTYYEISSGILVFSNDLMGTVGSGARVYVKK